ncbi:MAG: glutathione S-transferase C-terminal domain-containing protein, partial [Pseudomonadota bacterium]
AGVPHRFEVENNPGRGPLGKSPWAVIDGETVGDSERIMARLRPRAARDPDAGLDARTRARGLAFQRLAEEHLHQVLEWELFLHPAGPAGLREAMAGQLPRLAEPVVLALLRRRFAKQLKARGLGRLTPEEVAMNGRADLDAIAAALDGRPFLCGEAPGGADCAVYGQLAPLIRWPMSTPAADLAKATPALVAYADRMAERVAA